MVKKWTQRLRVGHVDPLSLPPGQYLGQSFYFVRSGIQI